MPRPRSTRSKSPADRHYKGEKTLRRQRARWSTGFTPGDGSISGLVLWLDAGNIAVADGAAVSAWTDRSSLANNLSQGTGANQPTLQTGEFNAQPVVRFDGGDYLDTGADPALNLDGNQTLFFVSKVTDTAGAKTIFYKGANGVGGEAYLYLDSAEKVVFERPFVEAGTPSTAALSTSTHSVAHVVVAGTGAGQVAHYTNGAANGTDTIAGGTAGTTVFRVGATINAGLYFTGDIAELLIYEAVLSAANQNTVGNYLANKYGLTWTAVT